MKKNEVVMKENTENGSLFRLFVAALLGIFIVTISYVLTFVVFFGGLIISSVLGKVEKATFDLIDIHMVASLVVIFFTLILLMEEGVGDYLIKEDIKRTRLLALVTFFLGAYIVATSYLWHPRIFLETVPYGLIAIGVGILAWLSSDIVSTTKKRRVILFICWGILITVGAGYQIWRSTWDLLQAVKLGLPIFVLLILFFLLSDVKDWLKAVSEIIEMVDRESGTQDRRWRPMSYPLP